MKKSHCPESNERGFILVVGLAILVVLTLLGVAGVRNATIDLKIAGNERELTQNFYNAETAWKVGLLWVKQQRKSINRVGTITEMQGTQQQSFDLWRYFGLGQSADSTYDHDPNMPDFDRITPDGTIHIDKIINGVPAKKVDFWYRNILRRSEPSPAGFQVAGTGSGPQWREFFIAIQAKADVNRVETLVSKVLQ